MAFNSLSCRRVHREIVTIASWESITNFEYFSIKKKAKKNYFLIFKIF